MNQKNKWRLTKSILKWSSISLFTLLSLGVMGFILFANKELAHLPKVNTQYLKAHNTTKIVDNKGNIIWQPTDSRTATVNYSDIDKLLYTKALINTEDKHFYRNKGFNNLDVAKMFALALYSKIPGVHYTPRGASTIDQQLIKNVFFNGGIGVNTTTRKFQELFLSKQLASNYSRSDILTFYVNNLKYSEGAQGIRAIMMTYFGKAPKDYAARTIPNIAEQAYLAGLGQAPSTYDLYTHPDKAQERKNIVLGVMRDNKLISQKEYKEAKAYDLTKGLKPRYWESEAQRKQNLKYKVYTDEVLKDLSRMGYNPKDLSMTIHTFLDQETFDTITQTVRQDRYFQDGSLGQEQVGATVINKDGVVIGMVGGRHEGDELNRATQTSRSSGSSTKPFTAYGPLLQYFGDQYNTSSLFSTADYQYPGTDAVMHNYGLYTYGTRSIQYALRMSLNTVVGRIDDQILGSNRMKAFLHGLGLDVKDSYSSVDGIGLNISTLQAAAAYNAINNLGVYTQPRFIDKITFSDGSSKKIQPKRTRAMNASTAWVLSQMLRGTVTGEYSAKQAAIPQYTGYAGKTGTVAFDDNTAAPNVYGVGGSDSWYDSITNEGYAISVWFGYDKPNTSPQVADAFDGPQYLGRDLQKLLNNTNTVPNWKMPENVTPLGGSGIEANYAITDAKDLNSKADSSQVDISPAYGGLNHLDGISGDDFDKDWASKLKSRDKRFYDLYQKNKGLLDGAIIDEDLYDILGGDAR